MPKNAPKFDPNKPFKVHSGGLDTEGISDISEQGGALGKAAEAVDIPASYVRAGAFGALAPETSAMEEIEAQHARIQRGSEGVKEGPTGADIAGELGMEDGVMKSVTGAGIEMVTDPMSYGPGAINKLTKIFKPIEKKIRSKAQKSAARALGDYVTTPKFLKEGVDPDTLAARMVEDDLVKHINNPEKLLEVIHGPRKLSTTATLRGGEKAIKKVNSGKGLVSQISDDLAEHIDDVSAYSKAISNRRISLPIEINRIGEQMSKISGVPYDIVEQQATKKFLKSVIGGYKESMSLKDAFQLKKNIGKQLRSREFFKSSEEAVANKKELLVSLTRRLDDIIKESLQGQKVNVNGVIEDAADYYTVRNNRMHHLLQIGSVLESVPLRELKNIDMKQLVATGVMTGMTGAALGLPAGVPVAAGIGGAMGGVGMLARSKSRDIADPLMAKTIDVISKSAIPLSGPIGTQATREMRDEPVEVRTPYAQRIMNRKPQSLMPAAERMEMNLPKQLIETRLPRDTRGLTENSKIFKLKVAQEAEEVVRQNIMASGMDPDTMDPDGIQEEAMRLYNDISYVLDEHPEEIGAMLPQWITEFPGMFEKDRYNRIDGVVPASMQPMVREEIRKNQKISNKERIDQLDLLNRSGEYKEQ